MHTDHCPRHLTCRPAVRSPRLLPSAASRLTRLSSSRRGPFCLGADAQAILLTAPRPSRPGARHHRLGEVGSQTAASPRFSPPLARQLAAGVGTWPPETVGDFVPSEGRHIHARLRGEGYHSMCWACARILTSSEPARQPLARPGPTPHFTLSRGQGLWS